MYIFLGLLNIALLIAVYLQLSKVIKFHTRWLVNIESILEDIDLCEELPSEWTSAAEDRGDASIKAKIKALRKTVIQNWSI